MKTRVVPISLYASYMEQLSTIEDRTLRSLGQALWWVLEPDRRTFIDGEIKAGRFVTLVHAVDAYTQVTGCSINKALDAMYKETT
jgi:hypothetical protein